MESCNRQINVEFRAGAYFWGDLSLNNNESVSIGDLSVMLAGHAGLAR